MKKDETYRHQICWVTTNREELKARIANEFFEDLMGSKSYSVARFLQFVSKGDERLNVPTTPDYLHNYIHRKAPYWLGGIQRKWLNVLLRNIDEVGNGLCKLGVEVDIYPPIT